MKAWLADATAHTTRAPSARVGTRRHLRVAARVVCNVLRAGALLCKDLNQALRAAQVVLRVLQPRLRLLHVTHARTLLATLAQLSPEAASAWLVGGAAAAV